MRGIGIVLFLLLFIACSESDKIKEEKHCADIIDLNANVNFRITA